MTRRKKSGSRGDAVMVIAFLAIIIMYSQHFSSELIIKVVMLALLLVAIVYVFVFPAIDIVKTIRQIIQSSRLRKIARSGKPLDTMTWAEFEHYVAGWLKDHGYTNVRLTEYYDLGVDIVAKKDGVTWGVQVKHYHNLVGIEAVRQVVVALKKYKCNRAMVVTNSIFSRPAIELAKSQDCVLIDRAQLV